MKMEWGGPPSIAALGHTMTEFLRDRAEQVESNCPSESWVAQRQNQTLTRWVRWEEGRSEGNPQDLLSNQQQYDLITCPIKRRPLCRDHECMSISVPISKLQEAVGHVWFWS